jgi:hypothetical protein
MNEEENSLQLIPQLGLLEGSEQIGVEEDICHSLVCGVASQGFYSLMWG